jgi:hypothetical protein
MEWPADPGPARICRSALTPTMRSLQQDAGLVVKAVDTLNEDQLARVGVCPARLHRLTDDGADVADGSNPC